MSQASTVMADPARISSVLLLDKDKLLQSIFRLSSFLTAPSNVNEILVKILDEVVDSIGFDKGIIRLFDDSRQNLEAKVVKNYSPEEAQKVFSVALNIHEHDCIVTKVAKSGQPIAVEVTATDPRITETDRMLTKIYDRGSYFCAPLKIGEEVIGIIAAWFKEETKFFPGGDQPLRDLCQYPEHHHLQFATLRGQCRENPAAHDPPGGRLRNECQLCPGQPYPGDPRQERPENRPARRRSWSISWISRRTAAL